jgi:hypothetical protein
MVLTPEVMESRRFGSIDERIGLAGFVEGVELYRQTLERLLTDTERRQE